MVIADISVSLDGYAVGPDPSLDEPLGKGGEQLHEWAFRLAAWRRPHGLEGGEEGVESAMVEEGLARQGAVVMGRKMFSGGTGPWEDDANANGWWGDDPPFHVPVFVVTHHERKPLELEGGTTFIFVDSLDEVLARARKAAGDRDVHVAGGASVVQQALNAGVVDELQLHFAPVLLGGGTRLLEGVGPGRLELDRVLDAPLATHVRYRVTRR